MFVYSICNTYQLTQSTVKKTQCIYSNLRQGGFFPPKQHEGKKPLILDLYAKQEGGGGQVPAVALTLALSQGRGQS